MVSDPLISIFARWPEPGQAKTRLIPEYGPEGAAAIYRKLEVNNKPGLIRALAERVPATEDPAIAEVHAPTIELLRNLDPEGPPPRNGASIAVMPFVNIGPAETAYFGHGIGGGLGEHQATDIMQ